MNDELLTGLLLDEECLLTLGELSRNASCCPVGAFLNLRTHPPTEERVRRLLELEFARAACPRPARRRRRHSGSPRGLVRSVERSGPCFHHRLEKDDIDGWWDCLGKLMK